MTDTELYTCSEGRTGLWVRDHGPEHTQPRRYEVGFSFEGETCSDDFTEAVEFSMEYRSILAERYHEDLHRECEELKRKLARAEELLEQSRAVCERRTKERDEAKIELRGVMGLYLKNLTAGDPDTSLLVELAQERKRQDDLWGPPEAECPSFDPMLRTATPAEMAVRYGVMSEVAAKRVCDAVRTVGVLSMADILIEEVSEVIASCAGGEDKTREELVQVGAVCVKWIRTIDLRANKETDDGK